MNIVSRKKELRQRITARLRQLSTSRRTEYDVRIRSHLESIPELAVARVIAAYHPLAEEPDLLPWLRHRLSAGVRVGLPRVVRAVPGMPFHQISNLDTDCTPGCFGIPTPHECLPLIEPTEIAAVIVPGLAFSTNGQRLGRGGGYYDRFLATCPGMRIAPCYEEQIVQHIPAGPHDLPIQILVTPERIIRACEHVSGQR